MDNHAPSRQGFGYSQVMEHWTELMSCVSLHLGDPLSIRWCLGRPEGQEGLLAL